MRLKAWAFVAVAASGVFAAHEAGAQQAQMPTVATKREIKLGARVEGSYDTNVSHSNKAVAALRGLKLSDYLATPAATVSIVQPFGRQTAFLQGDIGYVFHKYNPELDSQHTSLNGGLTSQLSSCNVALTGAYSASQTELTSFDLASVTNVQHTTTTGAGFQCARPSGIGIGAFGSRSQVKNADATRRTSDADIETLSSQIGYGRPNLGAFSLGYSYSRTQYPNRIIPGRPVGDSFFTTSYVAGYQRQFGSRLQVNGSGGLTHVKREFAPPGVKQSFNSATYNVDVSYGLGPRIKIEGAAVRAYTPSQQLGKSYDKSTNLNGKIEYKASPRLSFSLGAQQQEQDSNVDSTLPPGLFVTQSKTRSVSASATYSPTRRWSVALSVRHDDRTADLPQFNYTSTRIGLTAQANLN
ncbi:MAG: outer membrane beta-barrel protein [Caulobacterales bacterium]|nr:outer membrane beta-barrel protein [Caulobacterales bacterium]